MRVRQGWSGEVEPDRWAKYSVELDEADLCRLLPDVDLSAVPVVRLYQLLDNEAEILITAKLQAKHGFKANERLAELLTHRTETIKIIKGQQ
jgi:hypothetical protein